MPTILTKRSNTPGAVPATANLTNGSGGAELAVNTADKRLFTINSSSAVVEIGTNPSSLTCADVSATVLRAASATVTNLGVTTLAVSDLSATVARIDSLTLSSLTLTNGNFSSATITNLNSTSANITTLTGTTFGTVAATQLRGASAQITTLTATSANISTLGSARINPRVVSAATAASLTPDVGVADMYAYTALASALTINAPVGTPVDGNKLIFRILDNGTSRSLTWNGTYTAVGVVLPTATTISKTTYVGCIYNANNTRWDVVAVTTQT